MNDYNDYRRTQEVRVLRINNLVCLHLLRPFASRHVGGCENHYSCSEGFRLLAFLSHLRSSLGLKGPEDVVNAAAALIMSGQLWRTCRR